MNEFLSLRGTPTDTTVGAPGGAAARDGVIPARFAACSDFLCEPSDFACQAVRHLGQNSGASARFVGGFMSRRHACDRVQARCRVRVRDRGRVQARVRAALSALSLPSFLSFLTLTLTLTLTACNGGDNNGSPFPPTVPPSNPPSSTNPCAAALTADAAGEVPVVTPERTDDFTVHMKERDGYGNDQRDVREPLWEHYLRPGAGVGAGADATSPVSPSASQDIGDIAVLEDDGTLFLKQNAFDLRSAGLRFERNGSGGYDVTRIDPSFRQNLGSRVTLTDDDASRQTMAFSFPFYSGSFASVFVNSDGNLTFDEADTASTTRGFARLLGGPPRLAPFFTDLDPSTGGRVFVSSSSDAFVVTYCSVRGFESTRSTTVQAVLLPNGNVEFVFGDQIDLAEGIVALSPGRSGTFTPVDLSATGRAGGGAGAVGERFATSAEFDAVAVARKFYQTHGDNFDQLVLFSDIQVVTDAFAFESTISNAIRGIGDDTFNASADFGSAGRLQSYLVMDRASKYPDDPNALVLGENSTLAVIAHETGHRWLALLKFRDTTNGIAASDALLGRQRAHWSFFFDSDASVMEGNDIEALGGGSFRTVGAAQRYSRLDMYAMGLATPAEVSPFFYVDAPTNVQPTKNRESNPTTNVTFNGTRRDVLIQDIIDAVGVRQPSAAESPRVHRQAWIYVISRGATPGSDVQKLDRIRQAWPAFFNRATEGRMTVQTNLQ